MVGWSLDDEQEFKGNFWGRETEDPNRPRSEDGGGQAEFFPRKNLMNNAPSCAWCDGLLEAKI